MRRGKQYGKEWGELLLAWTRGMASLCRGYTLGKRLRGGGVSEFEGKPQRRKGKAIPRRGEEAYVIMKEKTTIGGRNLGKLSNRGH